MSSTYSQTISNARRQLTNSNNAIATSKKRICKGNVLVSNSKISITNSKYRFILSATVLINYFLVTALQKFVSLENLQNTQNNRKNERDSYGLTPQENLRQIMSHPFKTGLCPCCSHTFPNAKLWVGSWNCSTCGWLDNLFS